MQNLNRLLFPITVGMEMPYLTIAPTFYPFDGTFYQSHTIAAGPILHPNGVIPHTEHHHHHHHLPSNITATAVLSPVPIPIVHDPSSGKVSQQNNTQSKIIFKLFFPFLPFFFSYPQHFSYLSTILSLTALRKYLTGR